jgi:cytochrome c554/c'-like protein
MGGSRIRAGKFLAAAALAAALLFPTRQARGATAHEIDTSQYEGATTCQNSLCHGGSSPTRGQFVNWIWSRQDYHSRSYMTLVQSRSLRMAESLNIQNATTDTRCASCHAPLALVPPHRLAATARVDEGVSCETCHAPSENWLRSHTRTDYTYAQRVAGGMADLKSLYLRANACVACHQNIDPSLLGAGHPVLFFELDRQSVEEPAHWQDPDASAGLRTWLTGQCVAFRELGWKLSLGDNDPNTQAQWDCLYWLLGAVGPSLGLAWDGASPHQQAADYAKWVTAADALARQAAVKDWTEKQSRDAMSKLADASKLFGPAIGDTTELDFYRLKRIAYAVDSLQKPLKDNDLNTAALELVHLSDSPANFQPANASAALNRLAAALAKKGP